MKITTLMSLILLLMTIQITSGSNYSICFVHIGDKIPAYLETSVKQARLFNKNCDIYVLLNKNVSDHFKNKFSDLAITLIELESLIPSAEHEFFNKQYAENPSLKNGYWRFVKERFLFLNDLIAQYDLKNICHLENDVMLYVNLEEILSLFTEHPFPIAATFDHDKRAIAGFIYIRNKSAMQRLANFFANQAGKTINDMRLLGLFKYDAERCIGHLPIIMEDYAKDHQLISRNGHIGKNPSDFFLGSERFQSIFDAAAIGQFLGGLDPIHPNHQPGFVNESCVFNPSLLKYVWKKDDLGRKVPYAAYQNKRYRINNIHVHSKKLEDFVS